MSLFRPQSPVYFLAPHVTLPSRKVSNKDLLEWLEFDLKEEFIKQRTGIENRYWVSPDEALSDLVAKNLGEFFQKHSSAQDFMTYILSTISGDYPSPPTASIALHKAGVKMTGAFDLSAACAGFVTGLDVAAKMSLASRAPILLTSADIRSKFLNPKDLSTSILFGDCSATTSLSLQKSPGSFEILATELLSDGSDATIIAIEAGGSKLPYQQNDDEEKAFLKMKSGPKLFLKAVEGMVKAAESILSQMKLTLTDIDWVVPHQANLHLMREVGKRLGLPEGKMVETVADFGNTSGSTVAVALSELAREEKLKAGQTLLLISAGAGGLAACAVIIYHA